MRPPVAIALCLAALPVATTAHAKRTPVTITKSSVDNVNGGYDVRASSTQCANVLLQNPNGGGTLCGDPTCSDHVFFYGQHGKIVTFSWDRDARTIKPVKTVEELRAFPSMTVDLCAPNDIDYAMGPQEDIPDSAFRYQNINHASLNYTPVKLVFSGFNLITLDKLAVSWDGGGVQSEKQTGCESYPDPETNTCATFKYKLQTKTQRLSGSVSGKWKSDFFVDPLCPKPWETGCTPRSFEVPIDFSPARGTNVDAFIAQVVSDAFVEPIKNGGCSCPLVSL